MYLTLDQHVKVMIISTSKEPKTNIKIKIAKLKKALLV